MYRVKKLFYSIQGEGANTGRPAIFLRFSGCNLWSGRDEDRAKGPSCSAWCDTNFLGVDGPGGGVYPDAQALAVAILGQLPAGMDTSILPLVVLTGGEPLLQVDIPLIDALHGFGLRIALETNGTLPVPKGIDWVCVSPKANTRLVVRTGEELKLVYPQEGVDPEWFTGMDFRHFFLQARDGPELRENTRLAVEYCLRHPSWRLSVQVHKYLGLQ